MRIILSPVGTSILTNQAGEHRSTLSKYANSREKEMPKDVIDLITEICKKAVEELTSASVLELRRASAELNGIIGIYDGHLPEQSDDIHYLIATDTYQGTVTAEIVKKLLNKYFVNTQITTPFGLNTNSKGGFLEGIKHLLEWCDETLPGYQKAEYEIIFNLTGGFKSLQGYLNTIGMFYANQIAYIFESGQEVITIPKLPIKLEMDVFVNNASLFLQLSQTSEGLSSDQLGVIPPVMLDYFDDLGLLSTWGALTWNNAKHDILSKELIELPMIAYEDSFRKNFKGNIQTQEKVKLQETIAKVSCLLQENKGDISCLKGGRAGGILYDNYTGKNRHLGHFRLGEGPRVSCEYINQRLRLRHFGKHEYVNKKP